MFIMLSGKLHNEYHQHVQHVQQLLHVPSFVHRRDIGRDLQGIAGTGTGGGGGTTVRGQPYSAFDRVGVAVAVFAVASPTEHGAGNMGRGAKVGAYTGTVLHGTRACIRVLLKIAGTLPVPDPVPGPPAQPISSVGGGDATHDDGRVVQAFANVPENQ